MSYKHPLNVKIGETSASDCPHILMFSFEKEGKRQDVGYYVRNHPKTEDYIKRNEVQVDVSAVKDEKAAGEFAESFMENYPIPDKVYEHLFEFENQKAETNKKFDIQATAHDLVHNNCAAYLWKNMNMTQEEKEASHSYIAEMLKAVAEGKDFNDVPLGRPFLDAMGIKRDRVYQTKASTKESFERVKPSQEVAAKILKSLPEKPFETLDDSNEFVFNVAYGDREGYYAMNRKLSESLNTLAGDLIDIKIREDVSALIDRKLKAQLKQVRVEAKVQKKEEERKAAKEKMIEENKGTWAAEQEKSAHKKAAQDRLAEKGLVAPRGSKSGTVVHWGDSSVLAAKKKKSFTK